MGILSTSIADQVRSATQAAAPATTERKASDFWLNIGCTIDGTDGKPVFVSLPQGLALDDMKPQAIKGNNQDWIHLAQTKNALLEAVQNAAGGLKPGERKVIDLQVEIYRRAEPEQKGSTSDNPLLASLTARLGG